MKSVIPAEIGGCNFSFFPCYPKCDIKCNPKKIQVCIKKRLLFGLMVLPILSLSTRLITTIDSLLGMFISNTVSLKILVNRFL